MGRVELPLGGCCVRYGVHHRHSVRMMIINTPQIIHNKDSTEARTQHPGTKQVVVIVVVVVMVGWMGIMVDERSLQDATLHQQLN